MPCNETAADLINVNTKYRCNGIEININDISLNIVYKDKPNFFLNIKSDKEHEIYCPWCFNGKQDYDETGIDCGGSCIDCDKIQFPYKPPKPDWRLLIFLLASVSATLIWSIWFLRKNKL